MISPSNNYNSIQKLSFKNIIITNSFSNFLSQQTYRFNLNIFYSSFINFLSTPIVVNEATFKLHNKKNIEQQQVSTDEELSVIGCLFKHCHPNHGIRGGAIQFQSQSENGQATVYSSIFIQCYTEDSDGGAIFCCHTPGTSGINPTHSMNKLFNSSYCCYFECTAKSYEALNTGGYGSAIYAFSKNIELFYSSSVKCPREGTPTAAQFDLYSNDIRSSYINATDSTSLYCVGMEYRNAQSGFFKFQTFIQLTGCFITSLTNFQENNDLIISNCNFYKCTCNYVDQTQQDSCIIYVKKCPVKISDFCFVEMTVSNSDHFSIVRFVDAQLGTISISNCHYEENLQGYITQHGNSNIKYEGDQRPTNTIHLLKLSPCHGEFTPPPTIFSDTFLPTGFFTPSSSFSKSDYFTSSILFSESNDFTISKQFSQSHDFTFSLKFTVSSDFSNSVKFSKSTIFSKSSDFTYSNAFSSTGGFTETSDFSNSEKFSKSTFFSYSNQFTESDELTESAKFSRSTQFTESTRFTESTEFSKSNAFLPSKEFSRSLMFSESTDFSKSTMFTNSEKFSETEKFSLSVLFTLSNNFTKSLVFSPSRELNATDTFTPSSFFSDSDDFSSSKQFTRSLFFTTSDVFSQSTRFTNSIQFTTSDSFTDSRKFTTSMYFTKTKDFTLSTSFTDSNDFSQSVKFTISNIFSKSNVFSNSNKIALASTKNFSESSKYSSSLIFSFSSEFTESSLFSSSFHFSKSVEFTSCHFSQSIIFSMSDDFVSTNNVIIAIKQEDSSKRSPNTGLIAGCTIAVAAGIASAILAAVFINRNRKLGMIQDFDNEDINIIETDDITNVIDNPLQTIQDEDDPFASDFN